uniref:DM13 domain-containing protein n=1 Tax=Romanomermis culicivorax TaxID=13658 RepID=A0A915HT69_ROMCU
MIYVLFSFLVSMVARESARQYDGVFCGLIKESDEPGGKVHQNYNCFGSVWAMDPKRLKVKSFTFQPAFWHAENITFWLGPATKTGDEFHDMMPNDNGLYLEPEVVIQQFELDVPQTIFAKRPTTEEVLSIFNPKKSKSKASGLSNPKPEPEPINKSSSEIPIPEPKSSKLNPLETKPQKTVPEPEPRAPLVKPEPTSPWFKQDPKLSIESPFVKLSNPSPEITVYGIRSSGAKNLHMSNETITEKLSTNFLNIFQFENDKSAEWQDPFNLTFFNNVDITDSKSISNFSNIPNLEFDSDSTKMSTAGHSQKNDENTVQIMETLIFVASNETRNQSSIGDQNLNSSLTLPANYSENFDFVANQTLSITDMKLIENVSISIENMTQKTTTASTRVTTVSPLKVWKSLSWYTSNDVLLTLPENQSLSQFRWLSIYDHNNKKPIATIFLPNGKRFFYPSTLVLKGFKPNLSTKDVRSEAVEILDTKTIRIRKFSFEGDAPGAWFMVGKSIFPTVGGQIAPILRNEYQSDTAAAETSIPSRSSVINSRAQLQLTG